MRRDLRGYAASTQFRLIVGGALMVLLAAVGSAAFFYGPAAAVSALLCLVAALVPIGFIAAALQLMDWIVRRYRNG